MTAKKGLVSGLVDLHRPFCSADSQILGVVNRYKGHPLNGIPLLCACLETSSQATKECHFHLLSQLSKWPL